jgi:F-type H+-transporting ATPase subunit b
MARLAALIASGLTLALPAVALAAEGPASPIPKVNEGLMTAVAAVVVFTVCVAVLGTQVWPKISKGLEERARKIRDEIDAAEAARAQAKAALDQYERALADARQQAQKEIEQAKVAALAAAAEIKARNEAELSAMKTKSVQEIEAAKKQALGEIYNQAAALATMTAGKILRREINRDDQQRLVEETLGELSKDGRRAVGV